jgi:sugar phosphate isomerase/epimerase
LRLHVLSIHQSFVSPDKEFLKTQIEHTKKCIELAAKNGYSVHEVEFGKMEYDSVF